MSDDTVVVLTALNLEYEAVRERLLSPEPYRHPRGTLFEVGTLPGGGRVALGLTGKGNQSSAVLAERAIHEFSPAALLFVGVAGALWDTPLGDVVVATHVYAYHGGTSEDDGLKARPRVWESPHGIGQTAAHVARTGAWNRRTPPDRPRPEVHQGPIAAGEIVQNSSLSREAEWIRQTYNDALAIEMEGAGVAQAGHLSGSPVAIVRGISDRADGTKATGSDRAWQPIAAANAAAFALALAEELIGQEDSPTMQEDDRGRDGGSVTNTAYGNVGVQAGHVSGSTFHVSLPSSGQESGGLADRLAALREELAREHAAGNLDEDTHKAAAAELDIADKGIEEGTVESRKTSVLALKRLRGLIGELASLAVKVGVLITEARGLS
ncbi:5'-methylthioadenosine/S-adenosylhomocysteine nucleosidase [Nocardiopsis changdeensis]|uniref:5'-methylthioadenosine/S-adenosylhomocysteine nucleosidase n=1 Tax=Nocardiopsis changdeensis TaxID=2831969 RepID=A0ABX8BJE7_9ACTN|nr:MULTISPECIES: 5'-methylthioadenosine/S-adenosylhomocysteine nucleosidase [Nocardiopsis]QUX21543.1 5'-methylthioadenosine/S-adenosylhomocysteine nucleosidase [Nocardiopsis changdeensis]QYX37476.1 5'-methylthioadenosine/S-adenosylhomocysteine nucleosidase [Nocardiopsis sp. MT53]